MLKLHRGCAAPTVNEAPLGIETLQETVAEKLEHGVSLRRRQHLPEYVASAHAVMEFRIAV